MAIATPLQQIYLKVISNVAPKFQFGSKFNFAELPLSSPITVFTTIIVYLSLIRALQKVFPPEERTPAPRAPASDSAAKPKPKRFSWINFLFIVHNYFLSFLSLALLVLIVDRLRLILPVADSSLPYERRRYMPIFCSRDLLSDPTLTSLYYMNYLIKYYELLDTIFLVLKRKNLDVLHVYHHSATLFLCQNQLEGMTGVQWVPITLNLFVHVVMYYYYALTAQGYRPWWKQAVTVLQITQFVLDLVVCYSCLGLLLVYLGEQVEGGVPCEGTLYSAFVGVGILSSYLLLFLKLYRDLYSKSKGGKKENQKKLK